MLYLAAAHQVAAAVDSLMAIPIMIGDDDRTMALWKLLFDAGGYTNAILQPAVPPNKSLLRTSYMATHTDAQLDRVLEAFHKIGKQVGLIYGSGDQGSGDQGSGIS